MNEQSVLPVRRPARGGALAWLTEETTAGMARRKAALAYIFLLPTILGILVFTAGPVLVSLGLSLFSWDVVSPPTFIGFNNYQQFLSDPEGVKSFVNTFIYVALDVTLQIAVGLALALAMQQKMPRWLRYAFRSAFFLPLVTSGAAVSIVMSFLFNKDLGAINYYLGLLHIPPVPWLSSASWAMVTIVLTSVWQQMGFTFLVFTGGLGTISPEVLDAADVDGARGWRRLWYVTVPMLSPTILFVAVTGVIGALQVFTEPFVLTNGGPGDATHTVVMTIYQAAFQNLQIGYGSAVAALLFAVIMAVTAVQFGLSKTWVFYQ
jgi:multiple sugar transport system permease protein